MKTLRFGEARVDKIVEVDTMWFDAASFYPNIEPGTVERHARTLGPHFIDARSGRLALSFHSYLIRTRHRNILIDTCNGNDKPRGPKVGWQNMLKSSTYLANLARLGMHPEDIDIVLCTHLHCDHVGWNTRLVDGKWVPTFPNARYVMAREEFEHFARLHAEQPAYPVNHGAWEDSVLPVVAAGQADIVAMSHVVESELGERVWTEPAPGHTPGHITVHIEGAGQEAIMSGDIIHHPLSLVEPGLEMYADFDREQGKQMRRKLVERCADTATLLLTGHFPSPTAGRICSCGDRFTFRFAED